MLNKDDLKRFFENAKASRREFFEYIGKMSLVAMASSLNLSLSEEGQAEGIGGDVVSLLNQECLLCYLIGTCFIDGVFVPKVKYKIPVGFAETGKAGQFGTSGVFVGDYSNFNRDLNPYIPTGIRYGYVGQGQAKMQLYPHYYGFSPLEIQQIQSLFAKINKGSVCEPCLPAILADIYVTEKHEVAKTSCVLQAAKDYLTQLSSDDLTQDFDGDKQLANLVSSNIQGVNGNFLEISEDYASARALIPSVPSELFAFIWALPELSPDEEKWKNMMLQLQNAMQQKQIKPYELTCPYMANFITQFVPSGLDPSLVCIGLWGNGYPRAGDVETTDPIVGGLLSIARFQSLASTTLSCKKRTLVATPPQASWYQMYNPYIPEVGNSCFRPGWVFSDFTVNNFNNLVIPGAPGTIIANPPSASQIQEYLKDPEIVITNFMFSNLAGIAGSIMNGGFSLSGMLGDLLSPTRRNVGVIVWVDRTMCCVKSGGSGFGL